METVGDAPSAGELKQDLERLRAQVRADRRATSAPLLVFGGLVIGYAVAGPVLGGMGAGVRHLALLVFWPVLTALALLGLWLGSRRRAVRDGVGEGRPSYRTVTAGYLVTQVVIVVVLIPVLFVGVFLPLVWPAAVLTAIGAWQRNRMLALLGVATGAVGGLEGLFIVVYQGLPPAWAWLQSVVYALAGLALLTAGQVSRHRERSSP
jgi:hypothetical protein